MEFINSKIVEIKELTHNTKSFLLRLEDGKHFGYEAGQFIMLKANIDGEEVKRAYSVASPPPRDFKHAEYIELIIKLVPGGKLTTYLFSLEAGSSIYVAGPYGRFTLKEPIVHGDIFMATGSGIAPFMSMLRKAFRDHSPDKFWLFYGAINEDEVIYLDELKEWDKEHENFNLVVCLSNPRKDWDGEVGYVQDKLRTHFKRFSDKRAYLCGLPIMVEQSRQRLIELGVKPENIFQEEF